MLIVYELFGDLFDLTPHVLRFIRFVRHLSAALSFAPHKFMKLRLAHTISQNMSIRQQYRIHY